MPRYPIRARSRPPRKGLVFRTSVIGGAVPPEFVPVPPEVTYVRAFDFPGPQFPSYPLEAGVDLAPPAMLDPTYVRAHTYPEPQKTPFWRLPAPDLPYPRITQPVIVEAHNEPRRYGAKFTLPPPTVVTEVRPYT